MKNSTVHIEGWLLVLIAVFGFNQVFFGGDESLKYIDAKTRFWILYTIGTGAAAFAALKGFRSSSFSRFVNQEQEKENENKITVKTTVEENKTVVEPPKTT